MTGFTVAGGFTVICTDRGQHAWVRITTVTLDEREDGQSWHMTFGPGKGDTETDWWTYFENGTYEFRCPRCTRTPQIRRDLWWAIVEQTFTARLPTLDLSRLPL
jgi:hypothetical protein